VGGGFAIVVLGVGDDRVEVDAGVLVVVAVAGPAVVEVGRAA
jgi:hypothetical protein